jgi:hypothetical protein
VSHEHVADHDEQLAALRADMHARQVGATLDFSYESLDCVEKYYSKVLDASPTAEDLKRIHTWLEHYVGDVLASHTKGTWTTDAGNLGPQPAVKVPGIRSRKFHPMAPILEYRRLRRPGLLRDDTEKWDLPRRKKQLEALLASRDEEIARLRDDVEQITCKPIPRLDESSVDLIDDALRELSEADVTTDRRRQVKQRAALWLGTLAAEAVGHGEWTVVDDPKDGDFGQFRILNWAPARPVKFTTPKAPAGHLARNLANAIRVAPRAK